MKLRLTNYDPSEYKTFERMLNDLSKQGYNCKNVDIFTLFSKDNQRYYYKTDIFVPDKNNSKNTRFQRDEWLLNYVDHGYEFIGKSKKIYVFKARQHKSVTGTNSQLLLTYFKRNKTIANVFFIFITIFLSFLLIPSVFVNKAPQEFITNGSIILHYVPLLFCLALLWRFFYHHLTTEKIKQVLISNKQPKSTSKYPMIISNWLLISSIILIITGFILDYNSRQTIEITDKIITLKDLNLPGDQDTYNTYISSHSLMINESISYYETNGEDTIKVNYYYYTSKAQVQNALDDYLNSINIQKKKQITDGYLLTNDSTYNSIVFIKNKQLVLVQTTFDLLKDDAYKLITSFNY